MSEKLDTYLDGWRAGDPDMILSACADDFVIDDAVDGRFTKAEFGTYFGVQPEAPIEFSDIVTQEIDGQETQWGWFSMASQRGSFMNKADREGVHLTRVTYYSR